MKLFRNPEFKRVFILSCAVSLAASVLAFLWDIRYGLYMSAVCAVFLLVIYISTRQRYKKIASLADDLNNAGSHGVEHRRYNGRNNTVGNFIDGK